MPYGTSRSLQNITYFRGFNRIYNLSNKENCPALHFSTNKLYTQNIELPLELRSQACSDQYYLLSFENKLTHVFIFTEISTTVNLLSIASPTTLLSLGPLANLGIGFYLNLRMSNQTSTYFTISK